MLIRRELVDFKAGLGPDPGKYKGPVIDFEKGCSRVDCHRDRTATCRAKAQAALA
jgi:hypothetical protein